MTTYGAGIDAVIALLRLRLEARGGPAPLPASVDPAGIVAAASAHFVLPALGADARDASLPADLRDFLQAVEEANRARNLMLRDALARVAAVLNATGVTPLVLKGGAFLADPAAGDTAWRFMADLDLLVDASRLGDCVGAVHKLGFKPVREEYAPEHEAHYPPLLSPCGSFSIELHTRLFAVHDVPPTGDELRSAASPVELDGARLLLPSPVHRAAHLIAHAQIHNRFFLMRRVVLRDALDLAALIGAHQGTLAWPRVLDVLYTRRDRDAALAFLAWWSLLTGRSVPLAFERRHLRWAATARRRLDHTRWQRAVLHAADTLRAEGSRIISEKGHCRRRLALLKPSHFARTQAVWRHKLAQKLWA